MHDRSPCFIHGRLTFVNVTISGRHYFTEDCREGEDWCAHCLDPSLLVWEGKDMYYTVIEHHYVNVSDPAYAEREAKCLFNAGTNLFVLVAGTLVFQDSVLIDLRYMTDSVVTLQGGSVQLIRTLILRIAVGVAFIYSESSSLCFVTVEDCYVSGLNRDHAYHVDMITQGGFLTAYSGVSLVITGTTFQDSVAFDPMSSEFIFLIYATPSYFQVTNTVFTNCVGTVWLEHSSTKPSGLRNVTFHMHYSNTVVLYLLDQDLTSLSITDCHFLDNQALKGVLYGLVTSMNNTVFRNNSILGDLDAAVIWLVGYYLASDASTLTVSNCSFESNGALQPSSPYWADHYLSKGLLNDDEISNKKKEWQVHSACTATVFLMELQSPKVLLSIFSDELERPCNSVLLLQNVKNDEDDVVALLKEIRISSNSHIALQVGIFVSGIEGAVYLTDSVLEQAGVLLYLDTSSAIQLHAYNVTFQRVSGTFDNSGATQLLSTDGYFTECLWQHNQGSLVGALLVQNGNVIVKDSQFLNNSCLSCPSDLLIYTTTLKALSILINNCTFTESRAILGTAGISFIGMLMQTAVVSNCIFSRAVGESGAVIRAEHTSGTLMLQNLTFQEINSNSTTLILISLPPFVVTRVISTVIEGLLIKHNTFYRGIEVEALDHWPVVRCQSCQFIGNQGSAVWITRGNYSDFDSVYANNSAVETLFYQGRSTLVTLTGTVFALNTLFSGSAVLSIEGPEASMSCTNCSFVETASSTSVVQVQAASAYFLNSHFRANLGMAVSAQRDASLSFLHCVFSNQPQVLLLENSEVTVRFTSFLDIKLRIAMLIRSYLAMIDVNFTRISGGDSCLLSGQDSTAYLETAVIEEIHCGGAAFSFANSNVSILNSAIRQLVGSTNLLEASESSLLLASTIIISASSSGPLLSSQRTDISLRNVVIMRVYSQVMKVTTGQVTLARCNFTEIDTKQPVGVLACTNCTIVAVSNCLFELIRAESVAGLYANATFVTVESSLFCHLRASDSGSLRISTCRLILTHTEFFNNSAYRSDSSGGALHINASESTLQKVVFNSNSANAGGAIYWTSQAPLLYDCEFHNNSASYGPDQASYPSTLWTANTSLQLASGRTFTGTLLVLLKDSFSQIVTTDSHTQAALIHPALTGKLYAVASAGQLLFTEFSLLFQPGQQLNISITTGSLSLGMTFILKACELGETEKNKTCFRCPTATYSLTQSASDCILCPVGAECAGGADLYPLPGFWRPNELFEGVFRCPRSESCLGHQNRTSRRGKCKESYEGHMCQSCAKGASRASRDRCTTCPPHISIQVQAALLSTAMLGTWQLLAWTIAREQSSAGVLLRLLLDYLQLMALVSDFELSWPNSVQKLWQFHHYAGNAAQSLLPLDCLYSDAIYIIMLAASVAPLAVILLSGVLQICLYLCSKLLRLQASPLLPKCVNSIAVGLVYIHPFVVRVSLSAFVCEEIVAGERWLRAEMATRCWDHKHWTYSVGASLPSLLIWGFGLPALTTLLLIRYHRRLQKEAVLTSFLLRGFKDRFYLWTLWTVLFKSVLAVLYVFTASIEPFAQALLLLLPIFVEFLLQRRCQPLQVLTFNRWVLWSLVVVELSAYAGLYFTSAEASVVLPIVLFALHGCLLLSWLLTLCSKQWRRS